MKLKPECGQPLLAYELISTQEEPEPLLQEAVGHLKNCSDCRECWESIQGMDKVFKTKFQQIVPPPSLYTRIVEALNNQLTPIRQAIYEAVASLSDHLPLRAVYQKIAPSFPKATLREVTRHLDWLVSQGKLLELDFGEGFHRYDGNTNSHSHFLCQKCQRIFDLPAIDPTGLSSINADGHQILDADLVLHGVCKYCTPMN